MLSPAPPVESTASGEEKGDHLITIDGDLVVDDKGLGLPFPSIEQHQSGVILQGLQACMKPTFNFLNQKLSTWK